MTPEVGTGSDGFWPAQNRILPLAQGTLSQIFTLHLPAAVMSLL